MQLVPVILARVPCEILFMFLLTSNNWNPFEHFGLQYTLKCLLSTNVQQQVSKSILLYDSVCKLQYNGK